jgi:multiple sugar transport system permease protein
MTLSTPPDSPALGKPNAAGSVRRHGFLSSTLARVLLVLGSLVFLIPLYWMIITALKSNTELNAVPPSLLPQNWEWVNFRDAVQAFPFWTYFKNSFLITLLTVIGSVASNLVVAYGFACLQWRGRDKVFWLVLGTLFIPFPLAIIPSFDLFARLHWIDTYLPLVVPSFLGSAFFVFLLRQFLLQIPRDTLDSARIDGASEWSILWRIVTPLARPAIGAVAIFTAVASWNDFLGPLLYLQDPSKQTLSIGIQAFRSANDIQFNQLMAASVLILLPMVVLFFLFQRYFIRGLSLGSFK